MGSPPKIKEPPKGKDVPRRLEFETLPAAWFHTLIQKVRVMLKVDRKTELYGD